MKGEKREIPFDQPIKIALLFFHMLGFGAWYGNIITNVEVPPIFPVMTMVSGVLLVVRELYKDGWVWLVVIEGALNIVKVIFLTVAMTLMNYRVLFFSLIILFGLLSSHLPQKIREKRILKDET